MSALIPLTPHFLKQLCTHRCRSNLHCGPVLFSVGSQVSGPTQKIAGHKKCRGQVSRPGPRAGVMTRQGPPSPAQARPGRDVNDQIMSTACTGPWEAREGGGQFQIIEPSFGWPREQGTKPIFYHNPAIQFSTPQHHVVATFIFLMFILNLLLGA